MGQVPLSPPIPWKPILARAALVAIALGSLLTLVNQGAALSGAAEFRWLPFALVYATPFAVVTLSQILGIRAALAAGRQGRAALVEGFLATMARHRIAARAVLIGLAAASINTAIVATVQVLAGQGLDLPFALMAQALVLPALFGALSQTLSFRRTLRLAAAAGPGQPLTGVPFPAATARR